MLTPAFKFFGENWQQMAAIAGGAAAYMAGPAVIGAIVAIGPALLTIVAPMNAIRIGIIGVQLAMNPFASVTKVMGIALGLGVATLTQYPSVLKSFETGWRSVAGANVFSGAWDWLGKAADAVTPFFTGVYDTMADVIGWVVGTAMPGVFGAIGAVWNAFAPAAAGARTLAAGLWQLGVGMFRGFGPVVANV